MSAPKSYRWPSRLAARITDYQTTMGLKTEAEAVVELVTRGLDADNADALNETPRLHLARELRAALSVLDKLSGQNAANTSNEVAPALEEVRRSFTKLQQVVLNTDDLAKLAEKLRVWPELKEFSRMLDVWMVAYDSMIAGTPETMKRHFDHYRGAVVSGRELLRQLGVGNSLAEEIEARRPVRL